MIDRLRMVPLFGHLPEADLERLCRGVEEINLSKGATLFTEGEQAETAFVIASGEIEITKASDQHDVLIAVRKTNEVIGEMALLQSLPRTATARARTDATLLRIPKARIDELLETSISAVRAMFSVILDRWRGTEASATSAACAPGPGGSPRPWVSGGRRTARTSCEGPTCSSRRESPRRLRSGPGRLA